MDTKRILVVDDDKDIRSLLSMHLKKAGYMVEQSANGKYCMQQLEKFKPDLILLDLFMPVMDGFEVISEVRKKFKRANEIAIPTSIAPISGTSSIFPQI